MELPTADVRRFLAAAFSDEELDALCFDYFPRVYDDFASGMTKGQKIQALIEHCQRHGHMDSLAGALQKERGEQYTECFASAPAAAEIRRQPRDPRQVFISHARLDADFAHRLAEDLRGRGWAVWIAPESIRPGEKWVAAIERGLAESGIFLTVMTPNALQSRWVETETHNAIASEHEGQVRVIPLLAAPCDVTGLLKTYQQVSFLRSYEDGLTQLIGVLGGRPAEEEDQKPIEVPKRAVIQTVRSRFLMLWVAVLAVIVVVVVIMAKLIFPSPPAAPAAEATATASAPATQAPGLVGTQAVTPSSEVLTAVATITSSVGVSPNLVLDLGLGVTMEFVYVPGGEFMMGSNPAKDKAARSDEQPQHKVYVSDFYVGKHEVTVAQFASFVQATGYKTIAEKEGSGYAWTGSAWELVSGADWRHPSGPNSDIAQKADRPVTQISWDDAVAFSQWLAQMTGQDVHLPTEAEWEKACRGAEGSIYPWGDDFDSAKANTSEGGVGTTTPVGKYSPGGDNPYGASDMAGNVWEWGEDWYTSDEYENRMASGSPANNPTGPTSGNVRVMRGGSWLNDQGYARCSSRFRGLPAYRGSYLGFRVVVRPAPVS